VAAKRRDDLSATMIDTMNQLPAVGAAPWTVTLNHTETWVQAMTEPADALVVDLEPRRKGAVRAH
jgi:hypothetical protein